MKIISLDRFEQQLVFTKSLIEEMVYLESPSSDKPALDRLGTYIQSRLVEFGGEINIFPQAHAGDHFLWQSGKGEPQILLLCHFDTVFDLGRIAQQPFRVTEDKIFGPGVLDMKASIAMLLTILNVFEKYDTWPGHQIMVLFTSDEETGSLTSRGLVERYAKHADIVFCLEPALANGGLKTARKGTGNIEIWVHGLAAHAGVNHEKGRNAIEELAYHILAAQKLTKYDLGTTVNVGKVYGGTRGNVVPDEAYALIDFRVSGMEEVDRLRDWAENLSPIIQGTSLKVKFDLNRPPMPRDDRMRITFEKAQAIARFLGMDIREGSTGGGSDANFVAPLGVPVLDGLGGVGDGAHSDAEYVRIDSLLERSALLAALMLNW